MSLASPLCYTPTCTMEALNTVADRHTCYNRIRWLQSARADTLGLNERDACARVAKEFPQECNGCKPGSTSNCVIPPPTVLFSDGCSKSTAVMKLLLELLKLHGEPIEAPVYEPQICAQNYFCNAVPGVTPGAAIVKALRDEVNWAALRCRSVLLKVHCRGVAWREFSSALLDLGAARRSVALYRPNLLDVLICEVRDCMNKGKDGFVTDRRSSEAGALGGRSRTVNCSITRRQLPKAEQPMVWLDPQTLLARLREKLHAASHFCIRQSWPHAAMQRVSSELLLQTEVHTDPTSAAFNSSAAAWARLLEGLGVHAQHALLRAHLMGKPRRPATEATPQPHAQSIANAEQVHKVLQGAGGVFMRMWRT